MDLDSGCHSGGQGACARVASTSGSRQGASGGEGRRKVTRHTFRPRSSTDDIVFVPARRGAHQRRPRRRRRPRSSRASPAPWRVASRRGRLRGETRGPRGRVGLEPRQIEVGTASFPNLGSCPLAGWKRGKAARGREKRLPRGGVVGRAPAENEGPFATAFASARAFRAQGRRPRHVLVATRQHRLASRPKEAHVVGSILGGCGNAGRERRERAEEKITLSLFSLFFFFLGGQPLTFRSRTACSHCLHAVAAASRCLVVIAPARDESVSASAALCPPPARRLSF